MEEQKYSDIIFYNTPEGSVKIEVIYSEETFWLNQKRMGELFGCSSDNISLHLKNIFKETKLSQNSVAEGISATATKKPPVNTGSSLSLQKTDLGRISYRAQARTK
jgi:hypothetical protein